MEHESLQTETENQLSDRTQQTVTESNELKESISSDTEILAEETPKTELSDHPDDGSQKTEKLTLNNESYQQQQPDGTITRSEPAWSKLVKAVRTITPIIWITVIFLVVIPLLGQFFISRAFSTTTYDKNAPVFVNQPLVDWSKVDEEMTIALKNAHESARNYTSEQLSFWTDELMEQVDSSFLDWYFDYFGQKKREFKSFWVQLASGTFHLINPQNPTSEEKVAEVITEDFQREFAKRVLRPKIAQLRLERITQQTINQYLEDLRGKVDQVQRTSKIPIADWDRYLNDIAITIEDVEGNPASFSMKALVGGGSYLAIKPLVVPLLGKVGSQIAVKMSGKVGAKIAAKTGASLAGKIGAELLDPIVGVGIIAWDLWDYNRTVQIDRPILRSNIADYLKEVKFSLLENPVNGIMTPIEKIEMKVLQSI